MYFSRALNAKQFCTTMYHAGQAGIQEAVPYGCNPSAQSGHFQRHLDVVFRGRLDRSRLYELETPAQGKHDLSRCTRTMHVLNLHEELAEHMADPAVRTKLIEWESSGDAPPAYTDHPLVRAGAPIGSPSGRVLPVALYMDGVPYSQTDSALGFWLSCLLTHRRFLGAVLRKRGACKCGCRGWCTLHAVFEWVKWCLRALADGKMPNSRGDNQPWRPSDKERAAKACELLPMRTVVVYIKGDWAEYCSTLGFPTWQDGLRPCFCCPAFGADMYVVHGCSVLGLRWPENADDAYEAACARCEFAVLVADAATQTLIAERLRYDKRSHGSRGRCLTENIAPLGLLKDDRLEPTAEVRDIGAFETLAPPFNAVFWRTSAETLARHRCPLFCQELGLSPQRSLTVDLLHAAYLGVFKIWCRVALWFLILSGAFGNIGTVEETIQTAVLVLRHDLMEWYKARHRINPKEGLTRLSDLTVKMIGTRDDPKLNPKGAETWSLLLYLVDKLQTHRPHLGDDAGRYIRAGEALISMVQIWNDHEDIPVVAQQRAFEHYCHHMAAMEPDETYTPKHHLIMHLLSRINYFGNPRKYSTWLDESWNRTLKLACREVSQASFEASVLLRMREILKSYVDVKQNQNYMNK